MVKILSPYLYNFCLRYANSHEDAKDLLQESLILIFNNLDQFSSDNEAAFKSWCRRITINNALSKKRKKSNQHNSISQSKTSLSALPLIISKLNVEDILTLLNHLPDNQRLVFNLFVIDGYSHREIAKILNIKESSSRTYLTRARQNLQKILNRENRLKTKLAE